MRYTMSRGSAHSSFSLDVGVVATPIPHSFPRTQHLHAQPARRFRRARAYQLIGVRVTVLNRELINMQVRCQPVIHFERADEDN